MDFRKVLLTENECYKVGKSITPIGVMWHSTGANNPNLCRYVSPDDGLLGVNKYNNHWNQARPGGRKVCVHAFIGKDKNGNIATYQTLPFDMRGWHAGGSANDNYIGFEICEDALTDRAYFDKVYKEGVEFTAYLCELYNLDPMGKNVIICHADGYKLGIASNHGDIYHWFKKHGKTMDDVRKDVKSVMATKVETLKKSIEEIAKEVLAGKWGNGTERKNALTKAGFNYSEVQKKVNELTDKVSKPESFKVQVSITNLNIRKGPSTKYASVGFCPKGVYTIVETKTADGFTWGKLKSGTGWIALKYVTRV